MLLLDDYELDIFTLEDIKKQLGDKAEDINELIENLVHKRILSRMERGKSKPHRPTRIKAYPVFITSL